MQILGFVNMIQTGMLALQLLPDNSAATILVITDGVLRYHLQSV